MKKIFNWPKSREKKIIDKYWNKYGRYTIDILDINYKIFNEYYFIRDTWSSDQRSKLKELKDDWKKWNNQEKLQYLYYISLIESRNSIKGYLFIIIILILIIFGGISKY